MKSKEQKRAEAQEREAHYSYENSKAKRQGKSQQEWAKSHLGNVQFKQEYSNEEG